MLVRLIDLDENFIFFFLDFVVINNFILLFCFVNVIIIDVKFLKDIVLGNCEFVINKEV